MLGREQLAPLQQLPGCVFLQAGLEEAMTVPHADEALVLYHKRPVSPLRLFMLQRPGNIISLKLFHQGEGVPMHKLHKRQTDNLGLTGEPSVFY
jgi:hypothetical protein